MGTSQETCGRWALVLLAAEATAPHEVPTVHHALGVCEKLRLSLTRFVGPDGFAALLRRSLALARVEHPLVEGVQVAPDGKLKNLEAVVAAGESGTQAATAISARLLELLVAFVGESLTLRLVGEVWPSAQLGSNDEY